MRIGRGSSAATAAVAMLRAALESSNLPFNLDDARLLMLVDGESGRSSATWQRFSVHR
jgi:hypothetical protein